MELKVGIAKIAQYGRVENSETFELIERPRGSGYSAILSDGQLNGEPDKRVSNQCTKKISDSIFDGVRDSVALRAASDHLYTLFMGKGQAEVVLMSLDLSTETIVVSRNNPHPIYIYRNEDIHEWSNDSLPLGAAAHQSPTINEIRIAPGTILIAASDGVFQAGSSGGYEWDVSLHLLSILEDNYNPSAQEIANLILYQAIHLDENRPRQDMTVVVFQICSSEPGVVPQTRKVYYQIPFALEYVDDLDN